MSDDQDEFPECDSCHHTTADLKPYKFIDVELHLCRVCRETFIGNSAAYPAQYPDHIVLQQLAACTNIILDALAQPRVEFHVHNFVPAPRANQYVVECSTCDHGAFTEPTASWEVVRDRLQSLVKGQAAQLALYRLSV